MADEVQTFKALITIHKVLQEGHPVVLKEAQAHVGWLESLSRGVAGGDGMKGMSWIGCTCNTRLTMLRIRFSDLRIRLLPDRKAQLPQKPPRIQWSVLHMINRRGADVGKGTFEYEEYISLKSINDPNEG